MPALNLKSAGSCKYDLIALGEIMLRLDPGEGRVRCAREFKVWEGGGEYNVARGLRRCFGLKTAVCTAFADNDVGQLRLTPAFVDALNKEVSRRAGTDIDVAGKKIIVELPEGIDED